MAKRKEKCVFSVRIAGMKRQNGSVSVGMRGVEYICRGKRSAAV